MVAVAVAVVGMVLVACMVAVARERVAAGGAGLRLAQQLHLLEAGPQALRAGGDQLKGLELRGPKASGSRLNVNNSLLHRWYACSAVHDDVVNQRGIACLANASPNRILLCPVNLSHRCGRDRHTAHQPRSLPAAPGSLHRAYSSM